MSSIVADLIDKKTLRVVRLLLKSPDDLFHLQKISTQAKVPIGTTFRIIKKLTGDKILDTIIVGKTKIYRLNKENKEALDVLK